MITSNDKNLLEGWRFDCEIDFIPGFTYLVSAKHDSGAWATMMIEVLACVDGVYQFEIETILDGSPGIVEGWLGRPEDDPPEGP